MKKWADRWYAQKKSDHVIYWDLQKINGNMAVEVRAQLKNGDWILMYEGRDVDVQEKTVGDTKHNNAGRVLHPDVSDDPRIHRECRRFFGIEQQDSGDTQEILHRGKSRVRSSFKSEMRHLEKALKEEFAEKDRYYPL